jgi:hypothetical protein
MRNQIPRYASPQGIKFRAILRRREPDSEIYLTTWDVPEHSAEVLKIIFGKEKIWSI